MFRSTLILTLALISGVSVASVARERATDSAASPATVSETATPSPVTDPQERSERPIYGPILADDPDTRLEIKRLYREIRETEESTKADLQVLYTELASESDPDFRRERIRQAGELKARLEMTNIELLGQIARLNGQDARAEEFELALDQLRHPESYRPANIDVPVREHPNGQ